MLLTYRAQPRKCGRIRDCPAEGRVSAGPAGGLTKEVYCATMVRLPVIHGWNVQWYGKLPGVSGVKPKVARGSRLPESNEAPSSPVTVCATAPVFVQVIVAPTTAVRSS